MALLCGRRPRPKGELNPGLIVICALVVSAHCVSTHGFFHLRHASEPENSRILNREHRQNDDLDVDQARIAPLKRLGFRL
jgi:hypothetical protein